MAGKLVSKLAEAVKKLPDELNPRKAVDMLKNQGVKDEEILRSGSFDYISVQDDAGKSVRREDLERSLDLRTDQTLVRETKEFHTITFPDTNKNSYTERVYTNIERQHPQFERNHY